MMFRSKYLSANEPCKVRSLTTDIVDNQYASERLVIEFDVPKELNEKGLKGIFYQGRKTILINYNYRLMPFVIHKEDLSRTLDNLNRFVKKFIVDKATREEIKGCINANWESILSFPNSISIHDLEKESLDLDHQEHIARLNRLYGFNGNPIQPSLSLSPNSKNGYSKIFKTYVTIEKNVAKVMRKI